MSSSKQHSSEVFRFAAFSLRQDRCAMKVGTDAVLLGAWLPLPEASNRILDIGTGTGVLALLAAQRAPLAQVVGVEIEAEAAVQAAENAAASPFAERVKILAQSIQDYAASRPELFDAIVCNPPFFSGGVLSEELGRQTARHTVKLSHQALLRAVQQLLAPKGVFCLVLPKLEGLRFIEVAAAAQLYPVQQLWLRPRAGEPVHRLLLAFSRQVVTSSQGSTASTHLREPQTKVEQETNGVHELVQRATDGNWTEEYLSLVGPYYATVPS
ncbi:MAG: methyltransferase [Lewinella sp.]|nr:methyltransferase [Lewinella sp.]